MRGRSHNFDPMIWNPDNNALCVFLLLQNAETETRYQHLVEQHAVIEFHNITDLISLFSLPTQMMKQILLMNFR